MKSKTILVLVALFGFVSLFFVTKKIIDKPVVLGSEGIYFEKSIDEKINEAELILIGKAIKTLPSRYNGPDGKTDPQNVSPEEIFHARGLFTDSLISIQQILKGDFTQPVVRVRSFVGETEQVQWKNERQPLYIRNQDYLLFLDKDTGITAGVEPGDYISVNASMAVYEIRDGKAISSDDEWILDELIAYIQKSIRSKMPSSTPTLLSIETSIETLLPLTASPKPIPTDVPTETPPSTETVSPTP